jgi:hypothetical protein
VLSELWLDHCKLGALPERMPHLKTLKVHAHESVQACACARLRVRSAKSRRAEVWLEVCVQTLHLSANDIDALPRTFFGNLRLLEELSLDKNRSGRR